MESTDLREFGILLEPQNSLRFCLFWNTLEQQALIVAVIWITCY